MSCDHVQAVLLGESPGGPVHDHLATCGECRALSEALGAVDDLAQDLPTIEPPAELASATLEMVLCEMRPRRSGRSRWWAGGAAVLAAAALALAVLPRPPPPDLSRLVERGVGERTPEVALKVAVDTSDGVARLSRDRAYHSGDTLYFRANVDTGAWVALVRVGATGAEVVHQQQVTAGEADLAFEGGPLAWRLDPGEGDAVFALLAATSPVDLAAVEAALSGAYDRQETDATCRAVLPLGLRCSAVRVQVLP